MAIVNPFLACEPPWFLLSTRTESELDSAISYLEVQGIIVRKFDGLLLTNKSGLMDGFTSAFAFPDWFGRNWDALEESLGDLEWLPATGYCIWILNADVVLRDEPPSDLASFWAVLEAVAARWSKSVALGKPWDRPATPFHVGLQCAPDRVPDLSRVLERSVVDGVATVR